MTASVARHGAAALQVTVVEPLPEATTVDDVVLLHGWGTDSRIWRDLVPRLRHRCRVHLLDLPGFGVNASCHLWHDEGALIAALAAALPASSHLVGWSLGGNIALALAARWPERVRSLTLVACNPSFVTRDGHPAAMARAVFDNFVGALRRSPRRALSRFEQLQCRGDRGEKALLQALRGLPGVVPGDANWALMDALVFLGQVDQRQMLSAPGPGLPSPLFILGEADQLVPAALAPDLGRVTVLPGVAHLPMLAEPEALAGLVLDEIRSHPDEASVRRKQRVAHSFSRAARTYDSVAALQRAVGDSLLQRGLGEAPASGTGLGVDLGCGTGLLLRQLRELQPARQWLGGDIALGMLQHIRAQAPAGQGQLLVLDAERLPLVEASVELLFSNLALQWCEDLEAMFCEAARVLVPGGRLVFSTLVHGTLGELREAWSAVDEHAHVNHFYGEQQWSRAAARAGLQSLSWQQELRVTRYREVAELVHELKALGAHHINQGRATGLTGRSHWRTLRRAYDARRTADGMLPASWCLLYGVLEKPTSGDAQ